MAVVKCGELDIKVDEDGFMEEPEKWTKEVGECLAELDGVEKLTDDHWKVINYLRDYYLKYKVAPPIRMLVKQTGFKLKYIYELFPAGPAKGACKYAGFQNQLVAYKPPKLFLFYFRDFCVGE